MMRALRTGLFIGLLLGMSACASAGVRNGADSAPYVAGDVGG